MFDIGFSEVLLIFVLALIVLGPEKLPKVAAQVGRWIGRARGMARQFREQLEEEVNLEEARRAQPRTPPPDSSASTVPPAASSTAAPDEGTSNGAGPQAAAQDPGAQFASGSPAAPNDSDPHAAASHNGHAGPYGAAPQSGTASSTAAGTASPPFPAPEPELPVYPDTYSHAHPTDELGRPIPEPSPESPAPDSGQHDWVGGVTGTEKVAQNAAEPAYAPPHERGT